MKNIYGMLGIFMLFPLLSIGQISEKTVEKSKSFRRSVVIYQTADSTAVADSAQMLVLNGPQKKKIRTGVGADELSPLESARAKQAQEINGDRFFLEYQENGGNATARQGKYNQLTVRESNRRQRYLDVKRADMAQEKLQDFVGDKVSNTGYRGLVMNNNPYRTYTFSICPVNGGDNMHIVLGPKQKAELNLLPGVYTVVVSDSWNSYREQFRVPKQVYIGGVQVSWAVYNPKNL